MTQLELAKRIIKDGYCMNTDTMFNCPFWNNLCCDTECQQTGSQFNPLHHSRKIMAAHRKKIKIWKKL